MAAKRKKMSEALSSSGSKGNKAAKLKIDDDGLPPVFIGPPIPDDEARKRWPNRYLALKAILHPEQDRVLSIRENARLQGFPDYYKLSGPVKERYIQVGNAVAVPVSRSLGYALGLAIRGISDNDEPLFTLPKKFPCP